jgi:membrane associated rhomboid family serine protease
VAAEGTQKIIPREQILSRSGGAPATKAFIALAAIFFVLTEFAGLRQPIFEALAQVNVLVDQGDWWRLFTPVLLHASLTHILFNMWALWVLGPQIERGVGTWPFVGAYLASAAVGGAFAYFMGSPADVAVGASGAIFGLFGIWLNWAVRRRNTAYGPALLRQIGFLLLLNAALPLLIPNIAWEAHLGGLIGGFVIGELWSRVDNEAGRVAVTVAVAALAVVTVLVFPL